MIRYNSSIFNFNVAPLRCGKLALKVVAFLLCLALILLTCYQVLSQKKWGTFHGFYQLPFESADVLFYGSSHSHCTVVCADLYTDYGIAGYNLNAGGQPLGNTYYFVKESLKTQNPKVIVVELAFVSWRSTAAAIENGNLYRNTLGLRYSNNFYPNAKYACDSIGAGKKIFQSVLTKFPVIHTRYKELTKADFLKGNATPTGLTGYQSTWRITPTQVSQAACDDKEIGILREDDQEYLEKIIQLARDNDIKLLFYIAPFPLSNTDQQAFNAAKVYAEERQIPFINFNSIYQEIGLDYQVDMQDKHSHLNNTGAMKVTNYLGEYLSTHFDLPDRRGESGYALWEKDAALWENEKRNHALQLLQEKKTYLSALEEFARRPEYTVIVLGREQELFERISLKEEPYGDSVPFQENVVWVLEDGKITYTASNKKDSLYHQELGSSDLEILCKDGTLSFRIDKAIGVKAADGLNIAVYDRLSDRLVDHIGFNAAGDPTRK